MSVNSGPRSYGFVAVEADDGMRQYAVYACCAVLCDVLWCQVLC